MVLVAFIFLFFVAVTGGMIGVVVLALRGLGRALGGAPGRTAPPYVFRFNQQPGPDTIRNIPPNTSLVASTICPFCKRPARAVASRERIRVECRDCGELEGTADTPGFGRYSFPVR